MGAMSITLKEVRGSTAIYAAVGDLPTGQYRGTIYLDLLQQGISFAPDLVPRTAGKEVANWMFKKLDENGGVPPEECGFCLESM